MFQPLRLSLLCLTTIVFGACDSEPVAVPDAANTQLTTWHQDVAPIIHEKCVGCHHSEGAIAPFSLETFEEAGPMAAYLLQKVEDGEMPPWSARASDDCSPGHSWADDARLRPDQLSTLQDWVSDGATEGDPENAASLPQLVPEKLEGVTHELAMPAYTTSGFEDELRCFVLDPELATTQYMTGLEIRPSNLEVAHHATLTVVPAASAQAIRDREEGDTGFRCTGGIGISGSYSLGVWVPGAVPFIPPGQSGTPIAPGSVIVLQMHYHPTGFAHSPDETSVKLRMSSTKPDKTFLFTALGNASEAPVLQAGDNDQGAPRFFIPANVDGHSERMSFQIDTQGLAGQRVPIVAITPHMHYVGQHMQVSIERATPLAGESAEECLVNVKDWNFDWQRTYTYDAPLDALPTITQGDIITLKCDYNNTLSNRFVQRMLDEEGLSNPIDILLGDETTDEMCVAIIGVVF